MSDLDNSDYYTSEISDTEVDQDFDSKNTSTNGSKKILSQEKKNISANNSNLINKLYSGEVDDLEKEDDNVIIINDDDDINIIDDVDDDDDIDDDDDDDDDDDENSFQESDVNDTKTDSLIGSIEQISPINSDVESDDDDYLQKLDIDERNEYINKYHPECLTGNSMEIEYLSQVKRDNDNNIIDDNHKTLPFLTKYEKTKVLGQRASQINMGAKPYISVPKNMIDGFLIAQLELTAKKIPVIIRRPLPNRKSEYWKLSDLEQL